MKIAIPKESAAGETRVGASPATVKDYIRIGLEVAVEAGAGGGSLISDEEYTKAGATIVSDPKMLWSGADIVLKVRAPAVRPDGLDERAAMKSGCVLVCLLNPSAGGELLQHLATAGVTAFAMELVPRITRAQSMDALSSMSTIAGYKAVLLAANHLRKMTAMLMTAAGTIQPANCLVIGAGVAGLQAIATARRIGARVKAVDTRPAVGEQVESLGAKFIPLAVEHASAETSGGYAADLGEAFYKQEQDILRPHVKEADIVITTALIPNRMAPKLITADMVASMPPGAVIVDLAAQAGGNCTLTKPDELVRHGDVTILGPTNLPAQLPANATGMYSRNLSAFLGELVKDKQVSIDLSNEVIKAMIVTHSGQVTYAATK